MFSGQRAVNPCPTWSRCPSRGRGEAAARRHRAVETAFQPEGAVASLASRRQLTHRASAVGVPGAPPGIQVFKANKDDLDVQSERAVWHKAFPVRNPGTAVGAARAGGAAGAERGTVPSLAEPAGKKELENMTPVFVLTLSI